MKLPEEVDRQFLYQVLLGQALGSTGIGEGIAIRTCATRSSCMSRGPWSRSASWNARSILRDRRAGGHDALHAHQPDGSRHLHLLSRLGLRIRDPDFKKAITQQASRKISLKP